MQSQYEDLRKLNSIALISPLIYIHKVDDSEWDRFKVRKMERRIISKYNLKI